MHAWSPCCSRSVADTQTSSVRPVQVLMQSFQGCILARRDTTGEQPCCVGLQCAVLRTGECRACGTAVGDLLTALS